VHGWVVASFGVVGVMAIVAVGILEPANLAVVFEMRKAVPNGELVAAQLALAAGRLARAGAVPGSTSSPSQ